MMDYFAGIDAGSTYVKMALLDSESRLVEFDLKPTGIDADGASKRMLSDAIDKLGVDRQEIRRIVATGYGRRGIEAAHDTLTEIKAHALGAGWSAPGDVKVRTVIDIGGQDSKVIVLDDDRNVLNFIMNDKCAAGTGRFLESLARVLELDVSDLGPVSLTSARPLTINSTCVVFAESEVISLVARKKRREDIVAGIHWSLARRIAGMARKAGVTPGILLTGGGGRNEGIAEALEDVLLEDIYIPENPQLNGAVGAAVFASESV